MGEELRQTQADEVYARRAWNQYLKGNQYGETPGFADDNQTIGPFALKKEGRLIDRLLDEIKEIAPTPQRALFRPRFGYDRTAPGLATILNADNEYRLPNDGGAGGYAEINSSNALAYINTIGNT